MNNDYFFLENFYLLIQEGYSLDQALDICYSIHPHKDIRFIQSMLKEGYSVEEAIINSHLPPMFKEYFTFFQKKNVLSKAIENSLKICQMQNTYLRKIQKRLSYPLVLLVFLLLFSLFVVFILIPKVNMLFVSFNLETSTFIQFIMFLFQLIPIIFIILIICFVIISIQLYDALKKKKFKVIEFYLNKIFIKNILQKYFSLKFALYYNELLQENLDSITIIHTLNQQLRNSDIKIVLYEIEERMLEGELIENILEDFIYFDQLLITFFRMILEHHNNDLSLQNYIDITFKQIELSVNKFMKLLTSGIYIFVALFVIMVYISIIIPMMNVISEI